MKYIRFGKTNLEVSRLALGCTSFGVANAAADWHPETATGRRQAIETIHCALDLGINYFDTAPAYGDGLSESIVGEALAGRRDRVFLASKVAPNLTPAEIRQSIESSLQRLRTDYLDVIQFHGGTYSPEHTRHILEAGPLDMLNELRAEGKVRFIGFTSNENRWPSLGMITSAAFDLCQLQYNIINQAAAYYALPAAQAHDLGVTVMRPLTSGALAYITAAIAPEWHNSDTVYEVALRFLLSDSRVHMINTGMRWRAEVEKNVAVVNAFEPTVDMADIPTSVSKRYRKEDAAL